MSNELIEGSVLRTREQFDEVPMGTIIYYEAHPSLRYRREAAGWMNLTQDGQTNGTTIAVSSFELGGNRIASLPYPAVGQPLTSTAQLDALPTGSTFARDTPSATVWEKQPSGRWRSWTSGRTKESEGFGLGRGYYLVRSIGDEQPNRNRLRVDDTVFTLTEFIDLPVGTRINSIDEDDEEIDDYYQKARPDLWHHRGDSSLGSYRSTQFTLGGYRVVALPEGHVPLPSRRQVETLSQYQGRFVHGVTAMVAVAGVGASNVAPAFDELKVKHRYDAAVGMPVMHQMLSVSAAGNGRDLPPGTVLSIGEPEDYANFGLVILERGIWSPLMGEVRSTGAGVLRVAALPDGYSGDQTWFTNPPVPNDEELLRKFKSDAWKVGAAVKARNGWCSDFERYYAWVGLSAKVRIR